MAQLCDQFPDGEQRPVSRRQVAVGCKNGPAELCPILRCKPFRNYLQAISCVFERHFLALAYDHNLVEFNDVPTRP